jgi:Uma2 family endonuclease
MGLPLKQVAWISPQTYLLIEQSAKHKHEYLDGVVYEWQGLATEAMAGGTREHNRISMNIYMALRQQLPRGCEVYASELKVRTHDQSAYFYPDVVVSCAAQPEDEPMVVHEPCLVVEVLSPSTEAFDRKDKFRAYETIQSIEAYVLVSQTGQAVEVAVRDANGKLALAAPATVGNIDIAACGGVKLVIGEVFAAV